jgi:hypothetical protein
VGDELGVSLGFALSLGTGEGRRESVLLGSLDGTWLSTIDGDTL